jgi:hypothetical protein
MVIFSTHYSTMEHLTTDDYLKSINRLFQRTANTRCSLKTFKYQIQLYIVLNCLLYSHFWFHFISLSWNLCKYFCKYPHMQQYVIFNVLKEYCISKEEDSRGSCKSNYHTMTTTTTSAPLIKLRGILSYILSYIFL